MLTTYAIIHSQRNYGGWTALLAQKISIEKVRILNEIIENAAGLPVESQDLLLMMAKAMRHTRDCLMQQNVPLREDLCEIRSPA